MTNNTADLIIKEIQKEKCFDLRAKTGMGLMTCKRCLEDNDWDLEEAEKNHIKYKTNKIIN
jgi:translation elongation factor EF-Ts